MNYIDLDLLKDDTNIVYSSAYYIFDLILTNIASVKEPDYYLDPNLYIAFSRELMAFKTTSIISAGRDSENRPFISYCGIHFYMLSTDEAAKYQLLK